MLLPHNSISAAISALEIDPGQITGNPAVIGVHGSVCDSSAVEQRPTAEAGSGSLVGGDLPLTIAKIPPERRAVRKLTGSGKGCRPSILDRRTRWSAICLRL